MRGGASAQAAMNRENPRSSSTATVFEVNEDGKSEADLLLDAELAQLAIAEAEEEKLKKVADIRRRKEKALESISRLSRQ